VRTADPNGKKLQILKDIHGMIFKRHRCKIEEEKKRKKNNNDKDGSDRNDNSNNGQHEHRSSKRRTVLVSNEIRCVIIAFAVVAITLFGLTCPACGEPILCYIK
jgi:ABC-type Zn2+ transport system substrate-binding protein/surface adhesin